MFNNASLNQDIRIVEFFLIQTGEYQEQYLRPMDVNTSPQVKTALEEVTQGGRNLGINTVERVASSVLIGRSQTEGNSHIPNGWRSRRFSFIMRVMETPKFATGTQQERIFFGYTDHCDASTNYLPPDMRIFFNSEMTISSITRPNPMGHPITTSRVTSSNQIISPQDMAGSEGRLIHLMRPEDIFYYNYDVGMADSMTRNGFIPGKVSSITNQQSYSTLGGTAGSFKLNNRNDNSPSRYLQRTLQGYNHGLNETKDLDGEAGDVSVILNEAGNKVQNDELQKISFFKILKNECGYLEQGYVRYGDLCSVFPDLNNLAQFTMDDGRSLRRMSTTSDSNTWNGGELDNIAPSMLAQIVPSIMMENYIRQIDFTVQSGHMNEYMIDINWESLRMMSENLPDDVVIRSINEFKRRLEIDVLHYITQNNQMWIQIAMNTNLMSESVIHIAFDGGPTIPYVAPTFSDGLFNHLSTFQNDTRQKVAGDLGWLLDNTFSDVREQATNIYQGHQRGEHYHNPTMIGATHPTPTAPSSLHYPSQSGGLGDMTNDII